jgi:hypothetical protein
MQLKAMIALAGVALSATACGYAIKTATDYDRTVNFASYHTFVVKNGNSSGNPLLDQRAAADVRRVLTSKGWAEAPEGEGSAAVVIHAATRTKHRYETFYDGWGGWGWRRRWGGIGTATTFVEDYKVGTVVVDIFDAESKQAIWHGVATDALPDNATGNAEATAQAIDRMFSNFPPGELAR